MEKLSYFAQLNELFLEWMSCLDNEEKDRFCKDGLMLKAYKQEKSIDTLWDEAERRVMFVLKDKSSPYGDDTRLWLVDGKKGKVNRELTGPEVTKTGFLPNLARMLYGLVIDTKGFNQLDMKAVTEVWNTVPFAFVEAKKLAGYPTVSKPELIHALEKEGDFLMREIEILNPNIIVCCDGEDSQYDYITQKYDECETQEIVKIDYKYPMKPNFVCGLRYYPTLNKVVIKSFHPTRIGKSGDWTIYEKVISPFRQLLDKPNFILK